MMDEAAQRACQLEKFLDTDEEIRIIYQFLKLLDKMSPDALGDGLPLFIVSKLAQNRDILALRTK